MNCPNCKNLIPDTSTFCLHCGFKIISLSAAEAKQISCPECKKEIPEVSQFCPNCGYKIVEEKALIKCPHCRKKIPEDSTRCSECGYKMEPEVILYESNLMQCPNCRKNITQSSTKCGYCGFDFAYKNKSTLHVIWCPKCKADIISSAEKCHNCGFKLKPETDSEEDEFDTESFFDKAKGWIGAGVVLLLIFVGFKICNRSSNHDFVAPSYSESPSYSKSNTQTTSTGRYVVNADVVFAATSEANFNTLMNCVTSKDLKAIEQMVLYGQVKYLYKNDVVYLVKGTLLKYCIVRPEGSTESLYVICEQISPR